MRAEFREPPYSTEEVAVAKKSASASTILDEPVNDQFTLLSRAPWFFPTASLLLWAVNGIQWPTG